MRKPIQFFYLNGWLIPTGMALVFLGRWTTEIVVPTLKGGNFEALYELQRMRFQNPTLACTMIACVWAAVAVFHWAKKQADTD